MPENAAVKALAELATDAKFDRKELTITVAKEKIVAACEAVKAAGYNFFEDVTAVDWYPQEPRFQLSYHIVSHGLKERVRLAVRLDSADLTLDSITSVWPSANFYEREVFDLFGIQFRRPSASDAHHDAGELGGASAAEGLSGGRVPVGRFQGLKPEFGGECRD